ncbi:hypothetical protein Aduo_002947 [Ancylostoma duodenale]
MSSLHDISTTESVCSSNCTIDSASEVLSCCSESPDAQATSFAWSTADVQILTEIDFGSLFKEYGPPLFIHFYNDLCGNPVCRVGDFQDVSLTEAVKALNAQHAYTHSNNLIVRIDCCSENEISTILPILRLLLFRCRINFSYAEWERCVLQMADYKFAPNVVELLADFADKILELNIGSVQFVKEQRRRNVPDEEAQYISQVLHIWTAKCYSTLRCLRIFAFVRLDAHLSLILSKCSVLSHLTLSKISEICCPCFNNVVSFEFNGCGMGYTEQDLEMGKCLVKYFPSLRVIAFREVCFDPVVTSLIRSLVPTGQRFELYQIISVQQFASLMKPTFIARSPRDSDDYIELVNERYGTRLVVFDNHHIYRTPY